MRSQVSLFALLLVAFGCGPSAPVNRGDSPLDSAEQIDFQAAIPRAPRAPERKTSLKGLPLPRWPRQWHLAERGRFGADDLPVVWFQLEAGQTPVDEAAVAAADAIRAVAGRIVFEDLAYAPEDQRAIVQIRGSRITAAVEASRGQGMTLVRATLETKPGFGS